MKKSVLAFAVIFAISASAYADDTSDAEKTYDKIYERALKKCLGPRHVEGTKGVQYHDCVKEAQEKTAAVLDALYN